MSKLKVLFIITKSDTGGAQKYVRDLAAHLDPTRFEATILYGGKDLKWLSNRVYPWFLFLNDWFAVFELVRVLKKERPAIVHLNSSKAGIIGSIAVGIYKTLLRLNPKPYTLNPRTVFTAHGWVFNPSNYISTPVRFFYVLLHRFAALFTDVIVNVSDYDRSLALCYSIAPPHKLVTIHNGIDPNIPFLSREESRKKILGRLQNSSTHQLINSRWVGSLGRLVKEKNYATLIEAARLVPNAHFFIIGDGYEEANRKSQIANRKLQNQFFILKGTENDRLLLKAFDIFVLPSIKEGLPYSLLEAMAAGISAVVTNVGGMPEVARHCSTLAMVSSRNSTALADEIRKTLEHDNAKTTPCVPFSLQTMITETEGVYTGIEK